MNTKIEILNKKAKFSYDIQSLYEAGIQLNGTEIKSIRNNDANIKDSYCIIIDNEVFVKNMHIAKYKLSMIDNYESKRDRKLLLNRSEINKIQKMIQEKGMSVIPTKLFINNKGFAKLEIGIGKGKKLFDKRETIKKRESQIEIERTKKGE
tara:strand:+ start:123 stop:575 length:453 start_codon:yes stop_codon:yes gene_type:complete